MGGNAAKVATKRPKLCLTCGVAVHPKRQGKECAVCSRYRIRNGGARRPQRLIERHAARRMKRPKGPTSVYLCYDDNDELLYVGVANGGHRLAQHARTAKWWRSVKTLRIEHTETREKALRRESDLIAKLNPPFNSRA